MEIFGTFWGLIYMGGLNREGAYYKFLLRGEGLNRESGLNRAFTVSETLLEITS